MSDSLDQEVIEQLRSIAIMLIQAGMDFSDVVVEVHALAKTLVPQDSDMVETGEHASLTAEYTREAVKGLGARPPRIVETK